MVVNYIFFSVQWEENSSCFTYYVTEFFILDAGSLFLLLETIAEKIY